MAVPLAAALLRGVAAVGKFTEATQMLSGVFNQVSKDAQMMARLVGGRWYEMQDIAFKTARTMAMSREEAIKYNQQLIKSTKELAATYGVTAKELADFQKSYSEAIGRNVILTREQLAHMSALSKITDNATAGQLVDEFDKIGVGIAGATAKVGLMQERAKALGINATKATKTLASNIKLAASYSFKNGVADIEKMSLKATSLRMDMNAVMNAADKFMDIEGAISTSANIQMLGGSFAQQFSNPMGAMYEAMADPEAFMKRLERTISGKGRYNEKTGEVIFDPVTMMQMREMAKQLGMSVDQLTNPAMAKVQNQKVDEELQAAGKFNQWSPESLEAIRNLSRTNVDENTGKHYVTYIDEEGVEQRREIEKLTEDELKIAQDRQMSEEGLFSDVQEIKDILKRVHGRAVDTKSMKEGVEGVKGWWGATISNLQDTWMKPFSNLFNNIGKWFGKQYFSSGGIAKPLHASVGTIVPGDSYSGDKVPAMLNSGEMVLTEGQQKSMFNLISSLAMNGGMMYGMNRLGGLAGIGGLGSTMLMANMISGGDVDAKSLVEAHFMNKFLRKMSPFKKSIEATGEAAGKAAVETGGLASKTSKLFSGISTSIDKMGTKVKQSLSKTWAGKAVSRIKQTSPVRAVSQFTSTVKNTSYNSKINGGRFTNATRTSFVKADTVKGGFTKNVVKAKGYTQEFFKDLKKAVGASSKGTTAAASTAAKTTKAVGTLSKAGGSILKGAGKLVKPLGVALAVGSAISGVSNATSQYDERLKEIKSSDMSGIEKARAKDEAIADKNKAIGKSVGSATGMAAGTAIGATLGSVVPVVGTLIGGAIGGWLGDKAGGLIGRGVGGMFKGKEEAKFKQEQERLFGKEEGQQIKSSDDLVKVVRSIEAKMPVKKHIGITPLSLAALGPIAPAVAAIKALPDISNFMKVKPTAGSEASTQPTSIGKSDINLNVSGTIKLEGGGKSVDFDLGKLLDTPEFKRQLADIVTRRLNESSNSGKRNMESERINMSKQYNRSGNAR